MEFITLTLAKAWNSTGLSDLMNVTLLPYGNAQGAWDSLRCQHGVRECHGNMVQVCANSVFSNDERAISFAVCAERLYRAGQSPTAAIQKCAFSPTSAAAITSCYGGGNGTEALAGIGKAREKTQLLNHKYVPWVVINGQHSELGEHNLLEAVCSTLKKGARPDGCGQVDSSPADILTSVPAGACWRDGETPIRVLTNKSEAEETVTVKASGAIVRREARPTEGGLYHGLVKMHTMPSHI